jgi:hypothetical protein
VTSPTATSPLKRVVIVLVNTLLVLVIVFLVLSMWMPAIYTSHWFQENHWVRKHMLHNE